jgi:chitodextrinase
MAGHRRDDRLDVAAIRDCRGRRETSSVSSLDPRFVAAASAAFTPPPSVRAETSAAFTPSPAFRAENFSDETQAQTFTHRRGNEQRSQEKRKQEVSTRLLPLA